MDDVSGLFDIILGTRAMRRLKPDPVPWPVIRKILQAGQAAPSGGNSQGWAFIVVTDRGIMEAVQIYYQKAYAETAGPHYEKRLRETESEEGRAKLRRQIAAVEYLTAHMHECPFWIVACSPVSPAMPEYVSGASIYPAVQNMLLAARALGLGSTLTVRHTAHARAVDKVFKLPEGMHSFAILPMGYPMGNFGPVKRGPLSACVHHDVWGEPCSYIEVSGG